MELQWVYVSFANEDGFLGSAIVQAAGEDRAVDACRRLGICPDGDFESICYPLDHNDMLRIQERLRNRLLTEAEVRDQLSGKRIGE